MLNRPDPFWIQSRDNARFKHVRGLLEEAGQRRKHGQTLLEGVHLLTALLNTGCEPEQLWLTENAFKHAEVLPLLAAWPDVPTYLLPDALYRSVSALPNGIDILGVYTWQTPNLPNQFHNDVLILDNVQDAGNVGTLLRSAAAAGIRQVLCTVGTASVWAPRTLRAGMGAQLSLTLYEHVDLASLLTDFPLPLLATSSHATQSLYDLDLKPPVAWILGNEGQGISPIALNHAQTLAIPQPGGQESLNVSIAGSICLFEMVRQRLAH